MSKIGNILFNIIGVGIILLGFKISVTTGFAFVIGLCIGSIIEKLGWNDSHCNKPKQR